MLIDTEGKDFDILRLINFADMKPLCIYYEHSGLKEEDQRDAVRHLKHQGYTVNGAMHVRGSNTLACLVDEQ